jgi:hypothetical protein
MQMMRRAQHNFIQRASIACEDERSCQIPHWLHLTNVPLKNLSLELTRAEQLERPALNHQDKELTMKRFILIALILGLYTSAHAEISKETFKGSNFMLLVASQETEGKKGFRLTYDSPASKPSKEIHQIADYEITLEKFPYSPGIQTLLFRITAKKEKQERKLYVLYSGMVSYTAGTDSFYFYLSEEYQKSIRYYAMYMGEPTTETILKALEPALTNPDSALIATRWAGKESEVFIFDSNRLTKE